MLVYPIIAFAEIPAIETDVVAAARKAAKTLWNCFFIKIILSLDIGVVFVELEQICGYSGSTIVRVGIAISMNSDYSIVCFSLKCGSNINWSAAVSTKGVNIIVQFIIIALANKTCPCIHDIMHFLIIDFFRESSNRYSGLLVDKIIIHNAQIKNCIITQVFIDFN